MRYGLCIPVSYLLGAMLVGCWKPRGSLVRPMSALVAPQCILGAAGRSAAFRGLMWGPLRTKYEDVVVRTEGPRNFVTPEYRLAVARRGPGRAR